jgi:hypothetical protein
MPGRRFSPQSDINGPAPLRPVVKPQQGMEKPIQLLRALHEEMGATAWVALGVLLPVCIVAALIALRWIRRGGLASGSAQKFLAEQRGIARLLRKR